MCQNLVLSLTVLSYLTFRTILLGTCYFSPHYLGKEPEVGKIEELGKTTLPGEPGFTLNSF